MKHIAIATGLIVALASCGNEGKKADKTEDKADEVSASASTEGLNIAFYIQDSIPEHFIFYKEAKESLEGKAQAFESRIAKLQGEYQSQVASFQRQYQAQTLSQNQIQALQQRIAKKEESIMMLQQTEGARLQEETFESEKLLINKMEMYANEYAKEKGITLFLSKISGGQVLYADSGYDVTMDFIEFMNKKEDELNGGSAE